MNWKPGSLQPRIADLTSMNSVFAPLRRSSPTLAVPHFYPAVGMARFRPEALGICLAIFFLGWDFTLFRIANLAITISILLGPLILLMMFKPRITIGGLLIVSVAITYPLIVILSYDKAFDATEFAKSLLLSLISSATIAIIIFGDPRCIDSNAILKSIRLVLCALLIYTMAQVALASIINNVVLYYPFGEHHSTGSLGMRNIGNLLNYFSYEEIVVLRWKLPFGIFRGTGPYYEASALGRLAVTMMTISLLLTNFQRGWVMGPLIVLLSLSAGTIILLAVMLLSYLISSVADGRQSIRALGALVFSSLLLVLFTLSGGLSFMIDRLSGMFTAGETSSFIRVGGSLGIIMNAWTDNVFGAPLGTDEVYSSVFLYEQKIANGILELSLYYGPLVLVGFVILLLVGAVKALQADFARSCVILFVALCTVVSGSWLQIQFTFTLIPLFWALWHHERSRRTAAARC